MTLLENAYDFLNESLRSTVRAEAEPHAWKFAVLNVVQAIELLLKARLNAEHPLLVFQNVDSPGNTVSMTQAIERLASGAKIRLTHRERRSLRKAQRWRDQIVHYEFEMSPYEVESVYVQLFEFLTRFHDEHTDFGTLHDKIEPGLWRREAELFEFFRREMVTYNGVEVIRRWPTEILNAQSETTVELYGREYERLAYGMEPGWEMYATYPCHDCAVQAGQLHVPNCDVEACPRCFGQLITCGCLWEQGPPDEELVPREVAIEEARRRQREMARSQPAASRGPSKHEL